MTDFSDQLAGALHSSAHVKKTLFDVLSNSEEIGKLIEEKVEEKRKKEEKERKDYFDQLSRHEKILHTVLSKRAASLIAAIVAIIALSSLSILDIIDPRDLLHRISGTDDRIITVISGKSPYADTSKIGEIIDGKLVAILTSDSEPPQKAKKAIRSAVLERPFLVFHDWVPMPLLPNNPIYSEECMHQKEEIQSLRDQLLQTIERSTLVINNSNSGDGEKWRATNSISQAEQGLDSVGKKEKAILEECIAELKDPKATFSFYANLQKDSVSILLRILKHSNGGSLHAVNQQESQAFSASLTSVSLNNPTGPIESAIVDLRFINDGILEVILEEDDIAKIMNKNDPIYHLIVQLDRSEVRDEIERTGFIVAAVAKINSID